MGSCNSTPALRDALANVMSVSILCIGKVFRTRSAAQSFDAWGGWRVVSRWHGAGAVQVSLALDSRPKTPEAANVTCQEFLDNVALVKEHIQAGDIFQLVLSQRFERRTFADPFEIYRQAAGLTILLTFLLLPSSLS